MEKQFAEGKVTLPLIVAMRNGDDKQSSYIRDAILGGDVSDIDQLLPIIKATGGLQYANDMAQAEINQALHCLTPLPPSSFKEAMQTLAKFALERSY